MTFQDVRTYERPASFTLPNGGILRYCPEDGTVRILNYPQRPGEWDRLPLLRDGVPEEGWNHAPLCRCSGCRPDGWDVG